MKTFQYTKLATGMCFKSYPLCIQDPKDIYPVGRKIEYTCADGHDHIGNPIAECTENLTWKMSPMECKSN